MEACSNAPAFFPSLPNLTPGFAKLLFGFLGGALNVLRRVVCLSARLTSGRVFPALRIPVARKQAEQPCNCLRMPEPGCIQESRMPGNPLVRFDEGEWVAPP
jgi:hypothetical protein